MWDNKLNRANKSDDCNGEKSNRKKMVPTCQGVEAGMMTKHNNHSRCVTIENLETNAFKSRNPLGPATKEN